MSPVPWEFCRVEPEKEIKFEIIQDNVDRDLVSVVEAATWR